MNTHFRIDIVSDVSCPWCIIGYRALQQALDELAPEITARIHWQPFELNPNMPPEGQEIMEHLMQKYGIDEKQVEQNRAVIKGRGLEVGYEFGVRGGGRIYNTFDAHRLLHWAHEQDKQMELKLALFDLYFRLEGNPSDHGQLLDVVTSIGLNRDIAAAILMSDQYADLVRQQQRHYQQMGIQSVPAIIINNKHLISGGQPKAVFIQALKQLSEEE